MCELCRMRLVIKRHPLLYKVSRHAINCESVKSARRYDVGIKDMQRGCRARETNSANWSREPTLSYDSKSNNISGYTKIPVPFECKWILIVRGLPIIECWGNIEKALFVCVVK